MNDYRLDEIRSLRCKLEEMTDRYEKAELEKEQHLKKIDELGKVITFLSGQIEAYKFLFNKARKE